MSNVTVPARAESVPSRRLFLAASSATVFLSTVGKAKAETYPAAADPIFAAIDAAHRAEARVDDAYARIREITHGHQELCDEFVFLAKADGNSEKVSTVDDLNVWLDRQGPARRTRDKRILAATAALVFGIQEPPVADPSPEALAAWETERAAVVAQFESAQRTYDDLWQKADLPRLYAAAENAAVVSDAVGAALLATVPTTPAGGVAFIRYCVEAMDRFSHYETFIPAMENALAAVESVLAI